jgi:hypothetical protein
MVQFILETRNHTASQENEGGVIVYLSDETRIQRLGCTLWVANRGPISKVIKMTSSYQTITTIIPWTTDNKDPCMFTQLVNLC